MATKTTTKDDEEPGPRNFGVLLSQMDGGELLKTPASIRFVSAEPLLEKVDISPWLYRGVEEARPGDPDYDAIDWVIVGGESGPRSRAFELGWARAIRDQCKEAGAAFFMKQAGSSPRTRDALGGLGVLKLRKSKGGDLEELPEDLRVREFPKEASCPS